MTQVHVVGEYKHLGTIIDNRLKFDQNTDVIIKKSNQRLYVLRKLNSFNIQGVILSTFYNLIVESVLSFSFICWFSLLSKKKKENSLQGIINMCSKSCRCSLAKSYILL